MKKEQLYAGGKPFEPEVDLSGYVEKEPGKGLSENDFSAAYKEKIDNIEERAQKNTITGIKGEGETDYRTGNVNLTKENLGIGNVENKNSKKIRSEITREDVEKALQYTPEIAGAYQNSTAYTDTKIAELINGAPETLDTLKEVADAIQENKTVVDALDAAIGKKANQSELDTHMGNDTIHITAGEREKWNSVTDTLETVKGITDSAEISDSNILASSAAVHQVFQSVSSGKAVVASAITDRGVVTPADAAFQTMAGNIRKLSRTTGNAAAAQVLTGYTFSNAGGTGIEGTMVNREAVSASLNAGSTYAVPAGYHNGSGRITANSLAGQTAANAVAANITSGRTAWVNGAKVIGTGADNTAQYNTGYTAGSNASKPTGNAAAAQVLTGYTFSNALKRGIAGTMVNRGAVSVSLNAGGTYAVPAGYHNGNGRVTANSLAGQTAATATAAQITSGYTAWVNGIKITGIRAPQLSAINLPASILASGNGQNIITSSAIDFSGVLFFKIVYTYFNHNREALNIKIYNGNAIYIQQYLPKGYSSGTPATMPGLTAVIDVSGIGAAAYFQMYPWNDNNTETGQFTVSSMTLYAV